MHQPPTLHQAPAEPDYGRWRLRAHCRGMDPEFFMPAQGDTLAARAAKAVCVECPVVRECLHVALANHEQHGIWGGMSYKERIRYSRRLRADGEGLPCADTPIPVIPNATLVFTVRPGTQHQWVIMLGARTITHLRGVIEAVRFVEDFSRRTSSRIHLRVLSTNGATTLERWYGAEVTQGSDQAQEADSGAGQGDLPA